jgi:flavodoxin
LADSDVVRKDEASKSAVVIYDSRFGNTRKIGESLGLGLKEAGVRTDCFNSLDVSVSSLNQYDLICVGAPTEGFTASKPIKEFLQKLNSDDLSGKSFFAFDTKVSLGIFGSAAKYIEKELKNLDLLAVVPRESAIVSTNREGGAINGATLKEGEDKKFEEIGKEIGKSLVLKTMGKAIQV